MADEPAAVQKEFCAVPAKNLADNVGYESQDSVLPTLYGGMGVTWFGAFGMLLGLTLNDRERKEKAARREGNAAGPGEDNKQEIEEDLNAR